MTVNFQVFSVSLPLSWPALERGSNDTLFGKLKCYVHPWNKWQSYSGLVLFWCSGKDPIETHTKTKSWVNYRSVSFEWERLNDWFDKSLVTRWVLLILLSQENNENRTYCLALKLKFYTIIYMSTIWRVSHRIYLWEKELSTVITLI